MFVSQFGLCRVCCSCEENILRLGRLIQDLTHIQNLLNISSRSAQRGFEAPVEIRTRLAVDLNGSVPSFGLGSVTKTTADRPTFRLCILARSSFVCSLRLLIATDACLCS